MEKIAQLAGFFAAHAIWSVSDDGPLVPMYAYELSSGQRGMDRFVVNDSAEAQRIGRDYLTQNAHGAVRAVLVYDAILNVGGLRRDAVFIEAEDLAGEITFTVAVPYRGADSEAGFGVYAAYLVTQTGLTIARSGELLEPFFVGVDSHERGSEVWNSHLIEGA